jgi:hypothetical protein
LDWTPIGIARAYNVSLGGQFYGALEGHQREHFKPDSPEWAAELTRAVIGTGFWIMASALIMASLDDEEPYIEVFGGGPKDKWMRDQLLATGNWAPYTLRIGDSRLIYKDWPVLGIPLAALGQLSDMSRESGWTSDKNLARNRSTLQEEPKTNVVDSTVLSALAVSNAVLDKNMMQGISGLLDLLKDPSKASVSKAKRMTAGIVGGYTNPGLFKWLRNTLITEDGQAPVLDSTGPGVFYSVVPFSLGYSTPALNTLGDEIKQPWWNATTRRFFDSGVSRDPTLSRLVEHGLWIKSPNKNRQFVDGDVARSFGNHPDKFREYIIARGDALKATLTEPVLKELEAADSIDGQRMLDNYVDAASREAVAKIENR